jgi:hypothetical protein
MTMISAAEQAQMQADASTSLDQSFVIQRLTRVPDGTGHYSETWATVATAPGNLAQPTAGQMQNYGYKIGSLATWQVRLPVSTNVQENDQLVTNGQTLRVQVVLTPQSYQTCLLLLASEVK